LSPGRPSTKVSWCISTLSLAYFQSRIVPLDFSGDVGRSKGDNHTGLDDTSLNTTDRYCSNTSNLVDILEGETEGLVGRSDGGFNGVDGLEKSESLGGTGLGFFGPALEPSHVCGLLNHVVAVPSGDGDESNTLGIVTLNVSGSYREIHTDFLDEVGGFLDDFLVSGLGPLGGIHLVDGNDELFDTKSISQQSVLTGLSVLGDTGFELTDTSGDDDYGSDIYIREVVRIAQSACEVPVIMFLMKSR